MALPLAAEEKAPFYNDSITYELNPVVVTATGMHQRLKNSTLPVEVITAHEIEAAGINGLQEALTMMVPSLSFSLPALRSANAARYPAASFVCKKASTRAINAFRPHMPPYSVCAF